MKRKRKIIISGIISIVIVACGYFIFSNIHHPDLHPYGRYLWVFSDSAQENVSNFLCSGIEGKNDSKYTYVYKKKYFITIWEFQDLNTVSLNNATINQNINLENINFTCGESFDSDLAPSPKITVKYGLSFKGSINVNVDRKAEMIKIIDSTNYKGFYGNINRMTFNDLDGEPLILFDFHSKKEPTLLLLCKKDNRFLVILLNADEKFDESIISIFDL